MKDGQRSAKGVPKWAAALFAASLILQIALRSQIRSQPPESQDLPDPPNYGMLQLAAFGEPAAFARVSMLYLQSFDYHGTNALPYRKLDYARLTAWLSEIQALDPLSESPIFAAARVYAEVPDPQRQRVMLEFVYSQFQLDPNRRWPFAAHAALVAKHRLKDLPLALRYARGVERLTTSPDIPLWAKQMQIFILEEMDELEAARVMLGGLLASGKIKDAAEQQFLAGRLRALEGRMHMQQNPSSVRRE